MANKATGPVFDGEVVRWGSTAVSRRAYDAARELLADARQPAMQDSLQTQPAESGLVSLSAHDLIGLSCPRITTALIPTVQTKTDGDSVVQMRLQTNNAVRESMSAQEVAFEAGASYRTVRRWITEGKLPATRTKTGRLRVMRADFRRFMGFEK